MDSLRKLSLLALIYAHPSLGQERRNCYYPNGDIVLADRACDPEAEHSVCCGAPPYGVACMSNKLCRTLPGDYSRGSCTDPTWQSPECPSFCISYGYEDKGMPLDKCSNATDADVYCCYGTSDNCCGSNTGRLTLGTVEPFTWAEWVGSSTGYYTIATPLPSTSKKTSTSSISSVTTGAVNSSSGSNSGSTSPSETTPGSAQQTESSSNPSEADSSGLSTGAKAGIGIGAALGTLFILACVLLLWRLNRKNQKLREALSEREHLGDGSQWGPDDSVTAVGANELGSGSPAAAAAAKPMIGVSEMPVTAEKYELVAPHEGRPSVSPQNRPPIYEAPSGTLEYAELPARYD